MSNSNLIFTGLWLKNLLSFGNELHYINLGGNSLSVILGENLDVGGEDSRNGCGKSGCIDSLSFCLYGKSARGISGSKLVNKTMGKLMLTIVEYQRNGLHYRVERGIGPDRLSFYTKPIGNTDEWTLKGPDHKYVYERTQKRKDDTTDDIIESLGIDYAMFGLLVAISSEADPFLKMKDEEKRTIMENLCGIKLLAERAALIKEERRDKKIVLAGEESSIAATKTANQRVLDQIADMETRSQQWNARHAQTLTQLQTALDRFASIDIDDQLAVLRETEELQTLMDELFQQQRMNQQAKQARERESKLIERQREDTRKQKEEQHRLEVRQLERERESLRQQIIRLEADEQKKTTELAKIHAATCPTCAQHWVADPKVPVLLEETICKIALDIQTSSESLVALVDPPEPEVNQVDDTIVDQPSILTDPEDLTDSINQLAEMIAELTEPLAFQTIEEAVEASTRSESLRGELERAQAEANPHLASIDKLKREALVQIEYTRMDQLKQWIEHADLLVNLLTSSDSFLRKELIDRYLPVLNGQIKRHLSDLGLPHRVRFNTDLTCDITIGRDEYDYGNLSKGERLRLTLALNLAFLDLYEYMHNSINVLLIDELLDNGMDLRGAENGVNLLERMVATKNKRVLLITHRGDIADRVDDVIKIRKENGFSKIITK